MHVAFFFPPLPLHIFLFSIFCFLCSKRPNEYFLFNFLFCAFPSLPFRSPCRPRARKNPSYFFSFFPPFKPPLSLPFPFLFFPSLPLHIFYFLFSIFYFRRGQMNIFYSFPFLPRAFPPPSLSVTLPPTRPENPFPFPPFKPPLSLPSPSLPFPSLPLHIFYFLFSIFYFRRGQMNIFYSLPFPAPSLPLHFRVTLPPTRPENPSPLSLPFKPPLSLPFPSLPSPSLPQADGTFNLTALSL